jgi:hypothetical protein
MSTDTKGNKPNLEEHALNRRNVLLGTTTLAAATALNSTARVDLAQAQQPAPSPSGRPPNILVIMGDDVGWFNIGAYHQGIMSGKTPNLDKLAAEGMRFTDYCAEASCTAGRANFITGELPLRAVMRPPRLREAFVAEKYRPQKCVDGAWSKKPCEFYSSTPFSSAFF